jgi:hypothetical protein
MMTLFSEESLRMYHELSLRQQNFFIVLDATAKILDGLEHPFDNRKPFLFTVYVRCPERGVTGVPVYEFALSSQTFSSIASCLLTYFEK